MILLDDFYDLTGDELQPANYTFDYFFDFLKSIYGAYCIKDANGTYLWYINSAKTKHLNKMIKLQKPRFQKKTKLNYKNYNKKQVVNIDYQRYFFN